MLPSATEAEIAELAAAYGPPRRVVAPLLRWQFEPLTMRDRYGEVCMVIRRPSGRLLTARKDFYPPDAFRLLTGGVHHGERIRDALLREAAEETGLQVAVRRFLAVIEYPGASPGGERAFATFAFLLDETGGTLASNDPAERVAAFREATVSELPALAAALERAPDVYDAEIDGSWRDWGTYRAVVHRVVYATMVNDDRRPTSDD